MGFQPINVRGASGPAAAGSSHVSSEVPLVAQTRQQLPQLEPGARQQSMQSPPATGLLPDSHILLLGALEKHQPVLQPSEQLPPSADNAMVSSNDLTEKDRRIDQLESQLRDQSQELRRLRLELHRQIVDDSQQQRKDSGSQSQRSNEEIGRLQESSSHVLDDVRWMPMDASALAVEFSKLRKTVDRIAKSYAVDDFSALDRMREASQRRLWKDLSSTVSFESQGVEGLRELANIRHAPSLCLGSIFSHVVHREFLTNPPFFLLEPDHELQDMAGDYRIIACSSEIPSALFETFTRYDKKTSHIWRSDTFRLLNPTHLSGTKSGREQLDKLARAIEDIAKKSAQYLARYRVNDLLQVMDKTRSQKFIDELSQLFVHAGQLSLRLWCQRPFYQCRYMKHLAQKPFHASSEIMQLHLLHQHSDPLDTSLNGKLPKIVVHPAVLSFGTHEGEHYDQRRILGKAVVWLDV